ncbi:MAG: hypothetical protein EAZ18_06725 [Oscillatoriales cyanobacterium]|nr:MAG: hypothetical protein EAZ18_06725 [Oscillatoriales cyanobacterium]
MTRRCGKKPGFLGVVSETGFLREYWLIALNLRKNPVSWALGVVNQSETGFLREYWLIALNLRKNPVSWMGVHKS